MLTRLDTLNLVVTWTIDLLAFAANVALITAIILRTPKHLRTYSVFLLNNAIIDLISASASALGTVRIVQDHEGSMIFVFIGPCTMISEYLCRFSQGVHINLVLHSTIVLLLSFAFRLYIIDSSAFSSRRATSPRHIWMICGLSLLLMGVSLISYYLEQTSVRDDVLKRLHLVGYTTSNYGISGNTRSIALIVFHIAFSPIVMTLIFIVRRKLIARIALSIPTEKRLHVSIARALTYQLLLPCGVAIAAAFWMADLLEIWSSEFSERIIMVACSIFSLASPLINLTVLPPYRAIFQSSRKSSPKEEQIANCSATGLLLNTILIYAIRRFSGAQMGTYKQLLTAFSLSDLLLVILHELVNPRALIVGSTQGVVTDTFLDDRRVTAFFIAFQSVPFTLLVIHFLYRYWSVRRPHLIKMFSSKLFMSFLASNIAGAVIIITWYYLCLNGTTGQTDSFGRRDVIANYERKYGKRIENAWVVFDYWRDNSISMNLLITYSVTNVMMLSSMILISSLAFLTFHHIQRATKISVQANLLQRKLLIALCAQASVPCFFVYIPYLFTINIPFWRIPIAIVHDLSVPLTTFFPVLDATVVILLIPDYRRGLLGMLRRTSHLGMV